MSWNMNVYYKLKSPLCLTCSEHWNCIKIAINYQSLWSLFKSEMLILSASKNVIMFFFRRWKQSVLYWSRSTPILIYRHEWVVIKNCSFPLITKDISLALRATRRGSNEKGVLRAVLYASMKRNALNIFLEQCNSNTCHVSLYDAEDSCNPILREFILLDNESGIKRLWLERLTYVFKSFCAGSPGKPSSWYVLFS